MRTPCVRAFAPGRTELAGNHTDHQGGRVIAATIDCGITMDVRANGADRAHVDSEGFVPFEIDLGDCAPVDKEVGTTAALVRGVVACLRREGVTVGGFDVEARSTLPSGGGLSSSAAFELALAGALDLLFAKGLLGPETLAYIGQEAERAWFGKPCGLMDQLSIALGGVNLMDFGGSNCAHERIACDFENSGMALLFVDAHCDHSAYTNEYVQVARDMNAAAAYLGSSMLSEVPECEFMEQFEGLRRTLGDTVALRALHYYFESDLVDRRAAALAAGDYALFVELTRRSGASSAQYLQNVSTFDRSSQPAMIALALADRFAGAQGAARIHGGGFGGSIQVFVPADRAESFSKALNERLGEGSCARYHIASEGVRTCWANA